MKTYFYFFDLNEVLIDRYPAKIANFLNEHFSEENFIFIYFEKYNLKEPQKLPNGSLSFCIPDLSLKKISELIKTYPPNSLTVIAQRIPDLMLVSYFNNLNIPTFNVQHGLWSDKLERLPLLELIIKKFGRFYKYLNFSFKLCQVNHLPKIGTLYELYKFLWVQNTSIKDTRYLISQTLRAKRVFSFDESWDNYYTEYYNYNKNDLIYIGNPDFLLLKETKSQLIEDSVCYISQSLVEDGRYSLKEFEKFILILKEAVSDKKKLYIKLHPRSVLANYEVLNNNINIKLVNYFPNCLYYIGHYSSLIAVAKQCSDNILIWNLRNHHMPDYFQQFASIVTDNVIELQNFIKGDYNSIANNNKINRLTEDEISNFDPIRKIAMGILAHKL